MLKSILSVFGGAFGLILRVMLIILLCFLAGYCIFYLLTMPFLWGGLVRLFGAAACVFLIRFLIRLGRDRDDEEDTGL